MPYKDHKAHLQSCRQYYQENKNKWDNYNVGPRIISQEQKDRNRINQARRKAKDKYSALVAYSQEPPSCACCGESQIPFLTIEHSKNDGAQHRKSLNKKCTLYEWLKRYNYPQTLGLKVLCFNCNCGRKSNKGICPHTQYVHIEL